MEVPNLDVTGWYDHCNGTVAHLDGMQRNGRTVAAREHGRLLIGPWGHGDRCVRLVQYLGITAELIIISCDCV